MIVNRFKLNVKRLSNKNKKLKLNNKDSRELYSLKELSSSKKFIKKVDNSFYKLQKI